MIRILLTAHYFSRGLISLWLILLTSFIYADWTSEMYQQGKQTFDGGSGSSYSSPSGYGDTTSRHVGGASGGSYSSGQEYSGDTTSKFLRGESNSCSPSPYEDQPSYCRPGVNNDDLKKPVEPERPTSSSESYSGKSSKLDGERSLSLSRILTTILVFMILSAFVILVGRFAIVALGG